MKCAWCGSHVYMMHDRYADACNTHVPLLRSLQDAMWKLTPGMVYQRMCGPWSRTVKRMEVAVSQRDARERRSVAIDWSQPVDGWVLW